MEKKVRYGPLGAFQGRTNRATYWVWFAGLVALIVLANLIHTPIPLGEVLILLIGVPRLHDVGRTGWWAGGVLIVFELVAVLTLFKSIPLEVAGGVYVVFFGLVILLGAWPGTPGPNKFGNRPRRGVGNIFAARPEPEQDVADTFS
jgi:uncharacterized membrane protein YhaH (DUF805 family)